MRETRAKKILIVTSFLSIVILLVGTTFSFFTYDTQSKNNALAIEAAQIRINLSVSPKFTGRLLVPLDDKLLELAYNNYCIDDYGWGACQAYELTLFNAGGKVEIESFIDFNLNGVKNLKYMVMIPNEDEDVYKEENIYTQKTSVDVSNPKGLSLGENFTLEDGSLEQTSKKLILLIWLSDTGEVQDEDDAGGSFTASVTFRTTTGSELTGFIQGIKSKTETTSVINQ